MSQSLSSSKVPSAREPPRTTDVTPGVSARSLTRRSTSAGRSRWGDMVSVFLSKASRPRCPWRRLEEARGAGVGRARGRAESERSEDAGRGGAMLDFGNVAGKVRACRFGRALERCLGYGFLEVLGG